MPEGHRIAGKLRRLTAVPTLAGSGAYSSGQVVGTLLTLSAAGHSPLSTATAMYGFIRAVSVSDRDKQNANLDVLFFNASIAPAADQAAFAPSTADLAALIGFAQITSYSQFSTNSFGQATGLAIPFQILSGKVDLFALIVSRGTPTYANAASLGFAALVEPD